MMSLHRLLWLLHLCSLPQVTLIEEPTGQRFEAPGASSLISAAERYV